MNNQNEIHYRLFVHAGRQVKMAFVNSVAKPPRDVRRRQERFGTTSGASTSASTTAAAPIRSVFCCLDDIAIFQISIMFCLGQIPDDKIKKY